MQIITFLAGLAVVTGSIALALLLIGVEIVFALITSLILGGLGMLVAVAHTSTIDPPG